MGTEVDLHLALACQHLLWNGPPGGPERSPVLRACTTSTARPRGPANLTRSLAEPGPSREALMAAVRAQPARLSIGSLQRPGERAVTRARWHPQQPVFRPGRRGCDTAPGAAHDSMGCRLRADAPLVRTIAVANYCTGARVKDVDSVVILGHHSLPSRLLRSNRPAPGSSALGPEAPLGSGLVPSQEQPGVHARYSGQPASGPAGHCCLPVAGGLEVSPGEGPMPLALSRPERTVKVVARSSWRSMGGGAT